MARNIALAVIVMLIVVAFTSCASGAKIMLAMSTIITTPSQHIVMSAVTEPLVEKGHQVVLVAPRNKFLKGLSPGAVTDKIFYESNKSEEDLRDVIASISGTAHQLSHMSSPFEIFNSLKEKVHLLTDGCVWLFQDTQTLDLLEREKFDIMVTLPIVGCDVLLAQYLNIPYAVVSPVRRSIVVTEDHFRIPIPPSYVPYSALSTLTDRMSFTERLQNSFFRFVVHPFVESIMTSEIKALKRELNIRPDKSFPQLIAEADIWFSYTNFALDFPQPTAPNWIPIGGITAKPSQELPLDIKEFVEGSGEHGVIVFTLGSAVTSLGNEALAEMIAKVFSELPQRVLWRYKAKKPRSLGNNTLIADWLPQNDLLGHPQTRMLIYHGGAAGVYEATSHGVPLLIMPLAGDQMGNAARVAGKGLGRVINKNTMTEEEFREAVTDILTDPKYKNNMARASAIMKDTIVPPQQAVVFWIEHVLKFGGDHLRLRAVDLGFIEYHSLDVIAFLLAVLFTFIFVIRFIVLRCCCRMCGTRKVKSKSD